MEHWEKLAPGGLRLLWDDALFPPGTDSFLLSALPRPRPGLRVCDLGCGTGLVGFLLLQRQRDLSLTGVDREERAIALARRCAAENGLADRAVFETLDIRDLRGRLPAGGFDLVVSNPPYIRRELLPHLQRQVQWEPQMALDGGTDGLDFYRALPGLWFPRIRPGGWLAFEVGYDQAQVVSELLGQAGYRQVRTVADPTGVQRVVMGQVPSSAEIP